MKEKWCPNYPLQANLNNLASELKVWNREIFGNLFVRKRKLWARIEGIQRSLATGGPSYLLKLERKLRQDLDQTLDQISLLWFKKARVDQIRDGDRNTTYFPTSTIIRRHLNRIESLKDNNDVWQEDPQILRTLVVEHFQKLFSEESFVIPAGQTRDVDFSTLSPTCIRDLERPFTNEDVHTTLKGIPPIRPQARMVSKLYSFNATGTLWGKRYVVLLLESCKEIGCLKD